jgi:hypothetical protein
MKPYSWEKVLEIKELNMITSLDYNNGISVDIAFITDDHNPDSNGNLLEAFIYTRDGTGDYEPLGLYFQEIPTIDEIIEELKDYVKDYA